MGLIYFVEKGEKVRTLKASSDKTVWQPEVTILLQLKKQLESVNNSNVSSANNATLNSKVELEKAIQLQVCK